MLGRFEKRGWGSRVVDTWCEGSDRLETFKFDLVLVSGFFSNGRRYEVSNTVARQLGTMLVGIALSESSLWLSVVERGEKVLGQRSLNISMLESEARELLGKRDIQALSEIGRGVPIGAKRSSAKHNDLQGRKGPAA
jgi:hypothetical protein